MIMRTNSTKPSKQRKAAANAPLHVRQKMMAVHLSEALRKQLGKRNLPVRKGDEVRVMRGEHKGETGKVEEVDLKSLKVYIENVKRKKASGKEAALPFRPSKLMLTNIIMEDKERKEKVERTASSKPSQPAERTASSKPSQPAEHAPHAKPAEKKIK